MPSTKVIVIGKLGELAKKIVELEMLIQENPRAKMLLVELASYQRVYQAWPVLEREDLETQMTVFRYELAKLSQLEKDLRYAYEHGTSIDVCMMVPPYLKSLAFAREKLYQINALGKFMGDSIELEVDDELLRDEINSSSS